MNNTEHYQLNQWEGSDRILRTDFNADNAKIDAAIGACAAKLAGCGNCRIETFSYTGDGTYGEENPTIIPFSGKPTLYVIMGYQTLVVGSYETDYPPALLYDSFDSSTYITSLDTTWDGNQMQIIKDTAYKQLNSNNQTYQVVSLYAADVET